MDFTFNESQEALGLTAVEFFKRECPIEYIKELYGVGDRSRLRSLWEKAAEQGFIGGLIPEEYGGTGLELVDMVPILEAAGWALVPGPLVETAALAIPLLVEQGTEEQKLRWLPEINDGKLVVAGAITESTDSDLPAGIKMTAVMSGEQFLLSGTKTWVVDSDISDMLLVAAKTGSGKEDITLFLIPINAEGITITSKSGVDRTHHYAHISMNEVKAGKDAVIGQVNGGWSLLLKALNIATAAMCTTMIGGAGRVLEMAVEYANTRIQFGVPIGKFQAIKHRCADMKVMVENAKSAAYYAAWAVGANEPNAAQHVSIAKSYTSQIYSQICMDNVQIHGGIGFTWENEAHFYLKRAKANEVQYGTPRIHRERLAAALNW